LFIGTSKVFNSLVFNPAGFKKIQGYGFNDFHPKTKDNLTKIIYKDFRIPPTVKTRGLPAEGG